MEIDETFNSLEEVQMLLEKDGMTWRISIDDDIEDDSIEAEDVKEAAASLSKVSLESVSFSADADTHDIEKWEAELPDSVEEEECSDEETAIEAENLIQKASFEKAKVIYFDLFKKKAYVKTLIFQTEGGEEKEEGGGRIYRLIGFCEAPMF